MISEHANVGLYYFKTGNVFLKYGKKVIDENMLVRGEFYIAPMYNLMIEDGLTVTAHDTEKCMRTPATFEFFKRVITGFGVSVALLAIILWNSKKKQRLF